jgi:ethanolamine ammonia-lyase large subunit
MALADVPLKNFLNEAIIPYEEDEITRLIIDTITLPPFIPSVILRLVNCAIGY